MDRLAGRLGLETAYPVPVIREVTPAESQAVVLGCFGERGWVADADGGISISPGQEDSYATATYECTASYPVEAPPTAMTPTSS